MSLILGISAYYHDSAATLIQDGDILAAAQEERFTRKKHDASFPAEAIQYCLQEAGCSLESIDFIVFYDKPLLKFERLLDTYFSYAPKGLKSFIRVMPIWLSEKLCLKYTLKKALARLGGVKFAQLPPLLFSDHHRSHAASAFFPSPYQKAAVLCLDGVGEWATTTVWLGEGNRLTPLWQIRFPHSLGLLYSAFTFYTGFKVNSGEYKLMGLAPYGQPKYVDLILKHLIDVKEDGTFRLNLTYFNYATGLTMTNAKFHRLFGRPPRQPETEITQFEMDIARSIQVVTEKVVLQLARAIKRECDVDALCLAGGVALNCVANGKLQREQIFKDLWIQPAAGDAGGAVGAALCVWHEHLNQPRHPRAPDAMKGAYLGPEFDVSSIETHMHQMAASYDCLEDSVLIPTLARLLDEGNVIGWFQGRMEFGPRALGNRSIIGDPRSEKMQSVMNLKIKYRESFRPFAPAIKYDVLRDWFKMEGSSPYMLLVAELQDDKKRQNMEPAEGFGLLRQIRSEIPAITHVDDSARVQTVHVDTNPRFYALIDAFEQLTGCPILINTSFNVRGEPIVCSPEDAYRCFMRTEMDYLVMGSFLLKKQDQPPWHETVSWQETFVLD